jgi:PAS domain S-box-containing protein
MLPNMMPSSPGKTVLDPGDPMHNRPQTRAYFYLIGLVVFISICAVVLASVEKEVRKETIRQFNSYQSLQVGQASRGIENFFQHYLLSLTYLSRNSNVAQLDDDGKTMLRLFYESSATEIQAVTRMDNRGIILYTAPEKPGMIGTDIAYQEHVRKILEDNHVVVSDIFMSAQGYETVALHVPVFKNGEFLGSLAVLIPFNRLAFDNLEDIEKAGSHVWLLSEDGTELYSPVKSHIGMTVYEAHSSSPSLLSLADRALIEESGIGSFEHMETLENGSDKKTVMHAAYSLAHLPNSHWTVLIATPEEYVLATMEGFRDRWLTVMLILSVGSVLMAVIIVMANARAAEEALRVKDATEIRDLKEFNDSVLQGMAEGLIVLDQAFRITYVNASGAAILGIEPHEIIGRQLLEITPINQLPIIKEAMNKWENGEAHRFEINFDHPNGERMIISVSSSTLYRNNENSGIITVFTDTTDNKKAAKALLESEARYHNIFEGVQDAIFVIRLDGTIVDANPPACDMYGRLYNMLVGKNLDDLAMPGEPKLFETYMLAEEVPHLPTSAIHVRLDGSLFPVEISRSIQNLNNEKLMLVVVRDVSARVEREKELEAILAVAAALRTPVTVEEMLNALQFQILHLFKFEGVIIILRQNESDSLQIAIAGGIWSELANKMVPSNHTICRDVIQNGLPYISNDPLDDEFILNEQVRGDVQAVACLPLITQQHTIGVLWVGSKSSIGDKEIRLLTAISNIAANAIYRARLHSETQRRVQRLAALRNIDITITASLDLRLTLDILLGQVTSHLNVDAACVLLFNPNLQMLEFSTGNGFRTNIIHRTRLRLGEDLAGTAALERRIVHINDLSQLKETSQRISLLEAEHFATYIAVPLTAKGGIKGVLEIFNRSVIRPDVEWLDFLDAIAAQAAIAIDNARLFDDLQRSNMELVLAYDATLEGWVHALDLRDKETEGHTQRVTSATLQLAREMGIHETEMIDIRRGALLHDIGKVAISDNILRKTGPLDPDEREEIKLHPSYAYELLSPIAYLKPALDIPYCHHEKWDGSGYPRGLKAEQIPLVARVFAIVDVWDALRSNRPYRKAWPDSKVIQYICDESGKHFDPHVAEVFLRLVDKLNVR